MARRCSYFTSVPDGKPCFGGERPGVVPCLNFPIGDLVTDNSDGKGPEYHGVCRDHWAMRKGDLGPMTRFEERR